MRAFLAVFCVLSVLLSVGHATPVREKRFAPFPNAMAYAGGFPFGAFSSAGFNPFFAVPSVWDYTRPSYTRPFFPFPFIPFPVIPQKNWYEGENVCKQTKTADAKAPDEFSDWLKDDMPNFKTEFNHEQETCQGTNTKYVCLKRLYDNGQSTLQATKYECCHGFVRNPEGIGCIESNGSQPQPQPNTQSQIAQHSSSSSLSGMYYDFVPNQSGSGSSSSSSSGSIDKVPIQ